MTRHKQKFQCTLTCMNMSWWISISIVIFWCLHVNVLTCYFIDRWAKLFGLNQVSDQLISSNCYILLLCYLSKLVPYIFIVVVLGIFSLVSISGGEKYFHIYSTIYILYMLSYSNKKWLHFWSYFYSSSDLKPQNNCMYNMYVHQNLSTLYICTVSGEDVMRSN